MQNNVNNQFFFNKLADAHHGAHGHHKYGEVDKYGAHHGGKYGHLLGSYGHHGYDAAKSYAPVHGYHHYGHHEYEPQHHYASEHTPHVAYNGYGHVPYAASQLAPAVVQIAPVGHRVGVLYQ